MRFTSRTSTSGHTSPRYVMPSIAALFSRSIGNQRGNCLPILATVRWYRILQLPVFECCPFTRACCRPLDARIQCFMPSIAALFFRSTGNQRGNILPILATVRSYRLLQLPVFECCPTTRTCCRRVDVEVQSIMPSIAALVPRSTWDQRGNCLPIIGTVRWYRILQHLVFVICPMTRPCRRPADGRIQGIMPSTEALTPCSPRDQRSNCLPILVTVR
jgi:hypothetical protein